MPQVARSAQARKLLKLDVTVEVPVRRRIIVHAVRAVRIAVSSSRGGTAAVRARWCPLGKRARHHQQEEHGDRSPGTCCYPLSLRRAPPPVDGRRLRLHEAAPNLSERVAAP